MLCRGRRDCRASNRHHALAAAPEATSSARACDWQRPSSSKAGSSFVKQVDILPRHGIVGPWLTAATSGSGTSPSTTCPSRRGCPSSSAPRRPRTRPAPAPCVRVEGRNGVVAEGWGETPLSVAWVWPSTLGYETRLAAMQAFTAIVGAAWAEAPEWGHPLETGHRFVQERLPSLHRDFNAARLAAGDPPMPWLAALVCSSPFDIATHDAYGILHRRPSFATYNARLHEPRPRAGSTARVRERALPDAIPQDFLARPVPQIAAGMAPGRRQGPAAARRGRRAPSPTTAIRCSFPTGSSGTGCSASRSSSREPTAGWDYARMRDVGRIAAERGVLWLSADFNCTVARSGLRERDPRPAARRGAAHLRDDPLRRAAVPVRPRGQPHRRPLG